MRRYYNYEDALSELNKYKDKGYKGFVQKFEGMNNSIWFEVCVWQ